MRRAPKDSRARANLLRLLFSLGTFAAIAGTYLYMFHGFASEYGLGQLGLVLIPSVVVMLIVFVAVARQNAQQRALDRTSPAVPPETRRALFREACLLAILLERLGSESYLEKEIPPEIVVVTRRVLLDRLAAFGLRDNLEPWLLDLLLAPDGHWTAEQKQRAVPALECLVVLRWVLGLGELRSLTVNPNYSVAAARSLFEIKQPEELSVLPSWDVRPARDGAMQFFQRCWAELVARRAINKAPEADVEKALAIRAEIEGAGYTGDYLVGARTIPELDTPLLFLVARRAHTRWHFLALLVNVLSGEKTVGEVRKFLAQYFAPAEAVQTQAAEESR
ncbi:MAG: hypothetical protein ABSD59_19305 [Terracidiphilus sp.]